MAGLCQQWLSTVYWQGVTGCTLSQIHRWVSVWAKGKGIFGSAMVLAMAVKLLGHTLSYIITYLGAEVQCYIT